MGLVHFRVDDRLVHGIVAGYWTNHLQASRIMVIDDAASTDETVRASLRMATPGTVNLSVLDLQKAIGNIRDGNYEKQKVFVIAKSPAVFAALQKSGIDVPAVYMGNITYTPDRLKVAKTVAVNPQDIEALNTLEAAGTSLVSQLTPGDKSEDFMSMLRAAEKTRR